MTRRILPQRRASENFNIRFWENLAIARSGQGRLHMHRAAALLEHAVESLRGARPELKRLTVAGDFRLGCELVGDYAIVAEAPAGKNPTLVESGGLQVHVADRGHFGAVLMRATGSAAHRRAFAHSPSSRA
jgi:DNA polymerase (family 10)